MIILRLFFTFFVIGLVSFGGGYGMIPLIEDTVLANGWLTEQAFVSLIAVSESTPGPLAVNMATYIGSTVGGFIGALAATIGVVLPSFCIITAIAMLSGKLLRNARVGMVANAFLSGVRRWNDFVHRNHHEPWHLCRLRERCALPGLARDTCVFSAYRL